MDGQLNKVLVGCTGSVASLKLPLLVSALREQGCEVKVVVTQSAQHFIPTSPHVDVLTDADEWAAWTNRGDPVLHVDLSKWADVLLIAPLDANTLAKIALVSTNHETQRIGKQKPPLNIKAKILCPVCVFRIVLQSLESSWYEVINN